MEKRDVQSRQLDGCGYLPPPEKNLLPFVRPWQGLGYSGPEPTVCPGYSTNLPETQEIARAHMHWGKGALSQFLQGRPPSESMLIGIEILESELHKFEDWILREASKEHR